MDALVTSSRCETLGVGSSGGPIKIRGFRLLVKCRSSSYRPTAYFTADVSRSGGSHVRNRYHIPRSLVATYVAPTIANHGSTVLKSHPVCHTSFEDGYIGADTPSNGFHGSYSRPAIWNASFRNRVNRYNALYSNNTLAAAQGALHADCDSDESVSRRAFLKSLVQGRMQNVSGNSPSTSDAAMLSKKSWLTERGFDIGLGGGNNGVGGGKGLGGSGGGQGNDGFSFDGLGGWDGFFIAGTGSWVVLGAMCCLLTSVLAQIFRGAGSPISRFQKGSRPGGNAASSGRSVEHETTSQATRTHQGGSLSQATSRGSFRGHTPSPNRQPNNPEPVPNLLRCAAFWCKADDAVKVHYRGIFTRSLYPSSKVLASAYYRQYVGLVGPEPGDWVEDVEEEDGSGDDPLNAAACRRNNRSLDDMFVYTGDGERPVEETTSPSRIDDLNTLIDQLHRVSTLLKKSEVKRHEVEEELKESNTRNEKLKTSLQAKISVQEALNKEIRERLEHLQRERVSMISLLNQIEDLNKAVKTHKTNLRLMEKQLNVTSRERDAVLRRMESLQRDVNDIESLLDIVEKSRELVCQHHSEDYSEKILKANSCIKVLQQYLLKPTGSRHLSPIREVGNRVVVTFEKLMVELKRGFMQASKYIKQLEGVQAKLSQNSQDETILSGQLEELRTQHESLAEEKANIERTLITMQNTLAEAQENLDGKSRQETELRESMEKLTCDKDTIDAMMRSIQREVADIENLTQIMEKTRQLIVKTDPADISKEQVATLDQCLTALQQHYLKPTEPYEHVSRNISDRLVRVFEELLTASKQSIVKALESKNALKRVEEDLEGALSDESSLSLTIEGLRTQLNDMTSARRSLSNDVQMLKNELEEKTDSLKQLRMELGSLDEVREEQNKDIELLRTELDEKKHLLEASKQAEKDLRETLKQIGEERDTLQTKLAQNEEDLDDLKKSLENIQTEGKTAQDELNAVNAEKANLETQLAGLAHRLKDFEIENSRLTEVARLLRSNLDHERREKEQYEQDVKDFADERSELQGQYMEEIQTLNDRLESALDDCKKLEETCTTLEEAKVQLEKCLEEESNRMEQKMAEMRQQFDVDTTPQVAVAAEPIPSPFECMENGKGPSNVPDATGEGSDLTAPEEDYVEPEAEFPKQGKEKVLTWLDEAETSPYSAIHPNRESTATAPPLDQESSQILGSLLPASGRKIHRRLSWPQDMTFALNDNLLGAAQELVEMTTATLELAAEKNELETELDDVRQAINESRAQLEEREVEVSDLTEHFLQVYQIASDLAADNEEQSAELRDLRMTSQRQKQDIECRDQRIAMLETEFAMANMAPPRRTSKTNHYVDSDADFSQAMQGEPATTVFTTGNEYENVASTRLRSFAGLGYKSADTKGMSSPRFEAPGTPSMVSTTLDPVPPRANSRQTMTSVTQNYIAGEEDDDDYDMTDPFGEMSSLSSADDDGSDAGYPDAEHYPTRVSVDQL